MAIPVSKGRIKSARRIVIYGVEGVGKTSLAASIPKAIMIDADDGSGMFEAVDRYQFRDGSAGHVPATFAEITKAIDLIAAGGHGYETLVIDSLDRVEALMVRHVCDRDKQSSIEAYGYGKGWQVLLDETRGLLAKLDAVRSAGISVVLLAHAQVKKFTNPAGNDYDRYQLKCSEKVAGFVKEWCDELGFFHFDEGGNAAGQKNPRKGWSTGRRIVEWDRAAAWDAKCRLPLPSSSDVPAENPWSGIATAIDASFSAGANELIPLILVEIERIGDLILGEKVAKAVAGANGNAQKLQTYLGELRRRPALEVVQ